MAGHIRTKQFIPFIVLLGIWISGCTQKASLAGMPVLTPQQAQRDLKGVKPRGPVEESIIEVNTIAKKSRRNIANNGMQPDPEGSNYSADLYFQAMYQLARSCIP
ncbi:unnamed protein product [marine sediment metagenome]|uniref:Uncharacterized protein n=1 Tax=marine sediment metagenome TaxID=412755 RepID=X0Y3C6_9ZZZZ